MRDDDVDYQVNHASARLGSAAFAKAVKLEVQHAKILWAQKSNGGRPLPLTPSVFVVETWVTMQRTALSQTASATSVSGPAMLSRSAEPRKQQLLKNLLNRRSLSSMVTRVLLSCNLKLTPSIFPSTSSTSTFRCSILLRGACFLDIILESAPGTSLFLSLAVSTPRVCSSAHETIVDMSLRFRFPSSTSSSYSNSSASALGKSSPPSRLEIHFGCHR